MISINGAVKRSYEFPAPLEAAMAYYGNFEHIIQFLPHIRRVRTYTPNAFRLVYHTLELGAYDVKIFCDLQVHFDPAEQCLRVRAIEDYPPAPAHFTFTSLSAQGEYASESYFRAAGRHTHIEYHLRLSAQLPTPLGLSLVPRPIINQIAHNITLARIDEIADGFIEATIADFTQRGSKSP